jgi:hypothetical protein
MKEIERKWLLKEIPKGWYDYSIIRQFYLSVNPEVRLRKKATYPKVLNSKIYIDYIITVKGDGNLTRSETENHVTKLFYDDCLELIGDKNTIKKDYYRYFDGKHTVEISNVDNGTFIYAEVEFKSEEEALAYTFPYSDLVITEITDNENYKMKNYWDKTRNDFLTKEDWFNPDSSWIKY